MHDSFLEALAAPKPIPGGGAAAAHGACVGLALLEKIVLVELKRDQITSDYSWSDLLEEVKASSRALLQLRDEDGKAYMRFAKAKTFGKSDEDILEALKQAVESPMAIMKEAKSSLDLVARAGNHCKGHLLSDLLVVCELLRAAINGTHRITQANLGLMPAGSLRNSYVSEVNKLQRESRDLGKSVEGGILEKCGFSRQ
jgi:formiminotetrahydrofolate cyclodeaminase